MQSGSTSGNAKRSSPTLINIRIRRVHVVMLLLASFALVIFQDVWVRVKAPLGVEDREKFDSGEIVAFDRVSGVMLPRKVAARADDPRAGSVGYLQGVEPDEAGLTTHYWRFSQVVRRDSWLSSLGIRDSINAATFSLHIEADVLDGGIQAIRLRAEGYHPAQNSYTFLPRVSGTQYDDADRLTESTIAIETYYNDLPSGSRRHDYERVKTTKTSGEDEAGQTIVTGVTGTSGERVSVAQYLTLKLRFANDRPLLSLIEGSEIEGMVHSPNDESGPIAWRAEVYPTVDRSVLIPVIKPKS